MSGWTEELHPRDPNGEFAHGQGWAGKLSDRIGADVGEVQVSSLLRPKQGIKMPHPEDARLYQTSVPNSDLSKQDRGVVYKYAWHPTNFERMNSALRGDSDKQISAELAGDVNALTGAIGRNYLKKPVVVYRGVPDTPEMRKLLARSSFVDNGFMSTSTSREHADLSADPAGHDKGIMMKLKLPTGTKAISIGNMFESEGGFDQNEVLVQRGSKFKITSKRQVGGWLEVEAELISQGRP
jgi:hypothetical protein